MQRHAGDRAQPIYGTGMLAASTRRAACRLATSDTASQARAATRALLTSGWMCNNRLLRLARNRRVRRPGVVDGPAKSARTAPLRQSVAATAFRFRHHSCDRGTQSPEWTQQVRESNRLTVQAATYGPLAESDR